MKYIVALDQGTTSSRAVVFDQEGRKVAAHNNEFTQYYPQPGWVEHDPEDIYQSQVDALRQAVSRAGIDVCDIEAVGLTNQRETTVIWDRQTGEAIGRAIVWQCRRTEPIVERLKENGLSALFRRKTGLLIDAYFSGTKAMWLLDSVPGARERAEKGELCFGTVDSFLTWRLTGGKSHVTDATNASRTLMFNIHTQQWDDELLEILQIPRAMLPEVTDSSQVVGVMDKEILGREIPIAALAGDQHAALYGQACFAPGAVKNTYGTGCFMLMNTGSRPVESQHNLLTTMAWRVDGKPTYALEGSVFAAGAVIKWLRDEMKMIASPAETDALARSVPDNGGVYLVPAFSGLGAPYWDMYSRGLIIGLTRGSGRAHIVRAALEAIAYQTKDVLDAMALDSSLRPSSMRVDGGASANNFLMQFQADLIDATVVRPEMVESTARGAAMLAGRAVGMWSQKELMNLRQDTVQFTPSMKETQRAALYGGWKRAVQRALRWAE